MKSNVEIAKEMIEVGHSIEAARWVKMVAYLLPEQDIRAIACTLADAILQPTPRKRGDKSRSRDRFLDLARELAIVDEVRNSKGSRANAHEKAGQKFHKSDKTVERLCRKSKKTAT